MRLSFLLLPALVLTLVRNGAHADEGMWTLDAFPSDRVGKLYGFAPDQAWLDHVRLSRCGWHAAVRRASCRP